MANLRPARPVAAKLCRLAGLIAIFVGVLALGVYHIGAFALAVTSPLQAAVILGALAICAGFSAYSLVDQIVPGGLHRMLPAFLRIGITISLAIAIGVLFRFRRESNFWANNWACIRAGAPIGAVAAVASWLALCRGDLLSPRMTGLATSLFAGLIGTTAIEIHCPILDASRSLLSHLGVAVLGAMAGFVAGLLVENGKITW